MKFETYTRRQTQTLFDTISNHVTTSTKAELDALRAGVETRIKALEDALTRPEHAEQLEQLIQNLTTTARGDLDAARAEVEAAGATALSEAKSSADAALSSAKASGEAALASAKADAQAKIAAEQKVSSALRDAVEEARQQVRTLQTAVDAEQAAAKTAQAASQVEFERMRAEFEGRLDQVQAARAELARVLGDTQREAATAEAQGAANLASLEESQARVRAIEHECTELLVARDDAAARAEAEARRIAELTEALTVARHEAALARQDATLAKADAEGRRQGLEGATERIRQLEEMLTSPTAVAPVAVAAAAGNRDVADLVLLDHVGTALESIDVAISASEILETLIEQLGRHFARAAVFLVGPSSFRGWKGSGLGQSTDISNIEIPRTMDSLLTRALADRKPSTSDGHKGNDPAVGVLGSPSATALAMPVFANGRVIALAYAEHGQDSSMSSLTVGSKIAEILIDHANRRLTVKRRATAGQGGEVDRLGGGALETRATQYSPARQARRVTLPKGIQVTLEGTSSELVDLSTQGAQVLSPVAMRPKRVVKVVLVDGANEIVCKGRVVWAQFEQPQADSEARYRAGLKFTEADTRALDNFLTQHGAADVNDRSLAAKLEESA